MELRVHYFRKKTVRFSRKQSVFDKIKWLPFFLWNLKNKFSIKKRKLKKSSDKLEKSSGFQQNWSIFDFLKSNLRFWILNQFCWYLRFLIKRPQFSFSIPGEAPWCVLGWNLKLIGTNFISPTVILLPSYVVVTNLAPPGAVGAPSWSSLLHIGTSQVTNTLLCFVLCRVCCWPWPQRHEHLLMRRLAPWTSECGLAKRRGKYEYTSPSWSYSYYSPCACAHRRIPKEAH
jgi:hypothetical protein